MAASATAAFAEMRIVIFGKSLDKKTTLTNLISGKQYIVSFTVAQERAEKKLPQIQRHCTVTHGEWKGKPLTIVKTPDVFSLSLDKVKHEMKKCVADCHPGPNVLLLLVKPSDFTEDDRKRIGEILSFFGEDVFKHSMVVLTHEEKENSEVDQLIQDCGQRQHRVHFDAKGVPDSDLQELFKKMEFIVSDNRRRYLSFTEGADFMMSDSSKAPLNLILCGRFGVGKTSAAKAILGGKKSHYEAKCVKHQGEVCGRQVSLVELPALYGKPQEKAMKKAFRCISLCDPEGVHGFILVLPLDPPTNEDKKELETIQNTFSCRVNDFTTILFTVESDPTAPAVVNFVRDNRDIQELCQSCGGRSVVVNIKDKQQIPELLDTVDKMKTKGSRCFTKDMFTRAQMERVTRLRPELQEVKQTSRIVEEEEDHDQSREPLRMVLVGRTGTGKSATGNTILGKDPFHSKRSQNSVTKFCEKVSGQINGRPVVVVDTPGLFNTTLTNEDIQDEVVKCINMLAPGPHVFLLVLDTRYLNKVEQETAELIKKFFGRKSTDFIVIIFTGGDLFRDQSFQEYIDECSDSLQKLIHDCGDRYCLFNNNNPENRVQVTELLIMVETMIKKNSGKCYTNELLQEAEAAIQNEFRRILEEKEKQMQREKEELGRKYEEQMQEIKTKMSEQTAKMEEEREKLLEEKEENIKKEEEKRKDNEKKRKEEEENKEKEWKQKFQRLQEKIKAESESKEKTDKELEKSREEMRKQLEDCENERKRWWINRLEEDKQRHIEEKENIQKLKEENEKEKKEDKERRTKEDQMRKDLEEMQRKLLTEKHKRELENITFKYESEARNKAEEINEFKHRSERNFSSMMMKLENNRDLLIEQLMKEKSFKKEFEELEKNQKQEIRQLTCTFSTQNYEDKNNAIDALKTVHKEEINELIKKHVKKYDKCCIL